jgi:hypothetical protein
MKMITKFFKYAKAQELCSMLGIKCQKHPKSGKDVTSGRCLETLEKLVQ